MDSPELNGGEAPVRTRQRLSPRDLSSIHDPALPEGLAHANEITVTTTVLEGEVAVDIRDTGAGIPPDVLPHIFEQFYTTKPIGEGTGLGLAVSHRIVIEHGGHVLVDSELGKGSTIRVVLPLGEAAERGTS